MTGDGRHKYDAATLPLLAHLSGGSLGQKIRST
jgi:hypothetical protein